MPVTQEIYRVMLERASHIFLLANIDGKIEDANTKACELFGYSLDEFKSKRLSQVFVTGSTQFTDLLSAVKTLGKSEGEITGIGKGGDYFLLQVMMAAVNDETGTDPAFVGIIATNITQNKRLGGLLEDISSLSRIGAWELNLRTGELNWFLVTKEIHEVPMDYEPNLDSAIGFYKEGIHRDTIIKLVEDSKRTGKEWEAELLIVTAKGNEKWVKAAGKSELHNSKPIRLFGTFQDIHAKKVDELAKSKTDLAIRESQEQLNSVHQNINGVVLRYAQYPDGTDALLFINEGVKGVYGISKEEAMLDVNNLWRTIHEDDVADMQRSIQQSAKELIKWQHTWRIKTFDGKQKWLHGNGIPRMGPAGEVIWDTITFDITDQYKQADEIRKLSLIATETTNGAIITDPQGKITWTNRAFEKITGYSLNEVIGKTPGSLLQGEESDPDVVAYMGRQIRAQDSFDAEVINYHKNGTKYWVRIQCQPIFSQMGGLEGFFAIETDITLEKAQMHVLQQSEERFRVMAQNVPGAIYQFCVRTDGTVYIPYLSERFTELFKIPVADVIREWHLGKQIPEEDREGFFSSIARSITHLEDWNYEGKIICGDGEIKWFQGRSIPLKSGDELVFNGIFIDITDKKKAQKEREQLISELSTNNYDLKQFTYITSHNLRAPVTNLLAIARLLEPTPEMDEDTKELIHAFKLTTASLDETLNDLIRILLIKEATGIALQPVEIGQVLSTVRTSMAMVLKENKVTIETDFTSAPVVPFTTSYMESIILNLLTNSVKYRSVDRLPHISIRTVLQNNQVVLTYMDNGMGMDLNRVKDRVFGLYQRFHDHADGKGIGLYLIKSQVTALGGSIAVNSVVGKGTVFTITFKS